MAVCVTYPGENHDAESLAAWLDGKLARYKLPRHYVFWKEMPKSAYGKITKKLIRATLIERGDFKEAI